MSHQPPAIMSHQPPGIMSHQFYHPSSVIVYHLAWVISAHTSLQIPSSKLTASCHQFRPATCPPPITITATAPPPADHGSSPPAPPRPLHGRHLREQDVAVGHKPGCTQEGHLLHVLGRYGVPDQRHYLLLRGGVSDQLCHQVAGHGLNQKPESLPSPACSKNNLPCGCEGHPCVRVCVRVELCHCIHIRGMLVGVSGLILNVIIICCIIDS